jgi:hypothetical protein
MPVGTTVSNAITAFAGASGQASIIQNAATAVLGRFSQYTGGLRSPIMGIGISGTPSVRNLATQEYEGYAG